MLRVRVQIVEGVQTGEVAFSLTNAAKKPEVLKEGLTRNHAAILSGLQSSADDFFAADTHEEREDVLLDAINTAGVGAEAGYSRKAREVVVKLSVAKPGVADATYFGGFLRP